MANERTINYYPETTGGGGKVEKGFRLAEGLRPHTTIAGLVDTTSMMSQDDRAFTCTGTAFAEFFEDGSSIGLGAIDYDGRPSSMVTNGSAGHQVAIASAGKVYVYDTVANSFTEITDFPMNNVEVEMLEFMDGYVFALQKNSRRVYYSALEDATTWDFTFGYIERSWGSDNISFIKRSGRQLWLVGTRTTEVWADNGNANIPFAPIQGAFLDTGSIAPWSGVRDGETIAWVSQDERGGCEVVRAAGYQLQQISTYSIAAMVQGQGDTFQDIEAFCHQITGHRFYWIQVPGLVTTPVFDSTEREWSERAMWDIVNGVWQPHVARCHCYAFGKSFIGVRTTGVIYHLSSDYADNILYE